MNSDGLFPLFLKQSFRINNDGEKKKNETIIFCLLKVQIECFVFR